MAETILSVQSHTTERRRDSLALLRTAAMLLLAVTSAAAVCAQGEAVTLKMKTSDIGLLVIADVGGNPVLLFVDTGATYTHLDARYLKLPRSTRTLRTETITGGTDLRVLERVTLKLGDGSAARAFDLQTLDVDLSARRKWCKCDVAGVIGLDVLRRFAAFEVDFTGAALNLLAVPRPPCPVLRRQRFPVALRGATWLHRL